MPNNKGYLLHLFIKHQHGSLMREAKEVNLKITHGIEGDINANSMSPRQVLIVRHEDILDLVIPLGALRENIVISGISRELFTPGSLIVFDSGAAIRLTFHCEPCKRIAHLVDSLKTIQYKRGILGVIINPGKICVGNNFEIIANKFPALSEKPYERFLDFIAQIPSGKVVTYKHILKSIGVDKSYLRAIPNYLKKTDSDKYPIHRILDSHGYLIQYAPQQKSQLELENIQILDDSDSFNGSKKYFVDISKYLYYEPNIYLQQITSL